MSASNRLRHWDPPKARRSALRSANGGRGEKIMGPWRGNCSERLNRGFDPCVRSHLPKTPTNVPNALSGHTTNGSYRPEQGVSDQRPWRSFSSSWTIPESGNTRNTTASR
jgi:hypothetical protein